MEGLEEVSLRRVSTKSDTDDVVVEGVDSGLRKVQKSLPSIEQTLPH